MSPSEGSSREERLKGLALAKGWIGLGTFVGARDLAELVASGKLTPGQAEALERELDRPDSTGSLGSNRSQEGSSAFKATWLESWGHFMDLTLVAEGGMGRIFKAMDTRLQRRVALKMLRREDPELAARFLREASIQAQVEHPHVCRIYEAGEWMGQAYIAMQLIDGETLRVSSRHMTIEDKLDVMIQVCEGVHAAHQQGLIHRDIKPSNLMVRLVEGSWRAFVLDFGLARTLAATGMTQSGVVMGTVHYMSPEQARGEERSLDRRTDIYSLGATLYELLGGEPPFSQYQGLEALSRLLAEDAPRLRRRAPQIPRDLETVVMKCLERSRERRYANARELAGELRKVLEGEAVEARRVSWPERLFRWSRKNRFGMAAGAGLLMLLVGAGMLMVRDRMEARRRSALVAHMGTVAERMEQRLRIMRLRGGTPQGWTQFEEDLKELQRQGDLKDEGAPAARYAHGRVLLALGFEEEGCAQLEQAWAAGARGREVAWALGEGLVARLRLTRERARRLGNGEAGEAWVQLVESTDRPRALALLREGLGAGPEPREYQEALLAAAEGHEGEALRRTRAAFEVQPWLVEAQVLEGDLLRESAHREQDPASASAQLEHAAQAYESAARTAPEDGRPRLRAVSCWQGLPTQAPGRPNEFPSARSMKALEEIRRVPLEAPLADLETIWMRQGPGAPETLDRSVQVAEKLSAGRPGWHGATLGLIRAHLDRAASRPGEPEHFRQAIESARGLLERAPGHPYATYLLEEGLTGLALMPRAAEPGSLEALDGALQELRRIHTKGPQWAFQAQFEGRLLLARATREWELGRSPLASAEATVATLTRALALKPRMAPIYRDLAQAYLIQGRYEWWVGREAEAHLAEARRSAFRAQELEPSDPAPCILQGEAAIVMSELAKAQGRDPGAWLTEARRWIARLRELAPGTLKASLLEGQVALADPGATSEMLGRIAKQVSREAASGSQRDARLLVAQLALARGEWAEAMMEARGVARLDPTSGAARWVEALALEGQSQKMAEGPQKADLMARAQGAREQALSLNPMLLRPGAR